MVDLEKRDAQREATAARYAAQEKAHHDEHVQVVVDGYQRWLGSCPDHSPQGDFPGWAECAEVAITALEEHGVVFARMGSWDLDDE